MESIRRRRWHLIGAAAVLGIGINLLASNYLRVQGADSADAFRAAVGDRRTRVAAAALVDIGFALTYALVAASFVRRERAATKAGVALVVVGAAGDVVENLALLAGTLRLDRVSDDLVTVMHVGGLVKWFGIVAGALTITIDGFRRRG
jgi:hypothetical protein